MPELLERQEEIAAIDAALAAAAEGQGRLMVIEGEAGAGKSSLLSVAAGLAADREMHVLSARGGEQERDFAYALIRQLFESQVARRLRDGEPLTGAAALAAPVFDVARGEAGPDRLAVQHGLYWLTADTAAERPLALLMDDAHWADTASLQALLYVGRRLEGLPVALIVAVRVGEPDARDELLSALCQEPGAQLLTPEELSVEGALELGRREVGSEASEGFLRACHTAAAGNPFLLMELLHALASEGIAPTDDNAGQVTQLASAGVARSILLRLGRLGDEAVEVARCVAVLEPNAETEHVAALTGVPLEETAAHCERLIRARLLADARPLSFAHPLIREAVYRDIAAPRRAILHAEAARRLSASGAPTDSVAAHLLRIPPGGHDWVVVALRGAASEARARGAPEAASEYLERALSEPPDARDLLDVRQELGSALLEAADGRGIDELLAVFAAVDDPVRRGELLRTLGNSLALRGRSTEAISLVDEVVGELGPDQRDLGAHLLGQRYLDLVFTGTRVRGEELRRHVEGIEGTTLGERHLLGAADLLFSIGVGRTAEAISIARRAIADPEAIVEDALSGWLRGNSLLSLAIADHTELALELLRAQIAAARRRGSSTSLAIVTAYRAMVLYLRGDLAEAEPDAELARRLMTAAGLGRTWPLAAAALVWVRMERGDLRAAAETLSAGDLSGDQLVSGIPGAALLCARGSLSNAMGRHEEARRDFTSAGERIGWLPYPNAELFGWRPGLALAEFALGNHEEAQGLAAEAVRIAGEAGNPRGVGVTLRVQGVITGHEGIDLLRESVDTLAATTGRLQHAHALVDLGAALRRANRRRESREPLQQGMELARRCGAEPLEERARTELAATGARPRKAVVSGVESLTPSELRIARLAAEGMTNREIAQTLFVSLKTVEFHLRHCFQKLGIERRTELASVLAADSPVAAGAAPAP